MNLIQKSIHSVFVLCFSLVALFAKEQIVGSSEFQDNFNGLAKEVSNPTKTVMNINNIQIWVDKRGFFPWDGTATGTAGEYPKGTGGLIFAEGMLWGAKVSDADTTQRVRVNGATYASGLKAGKVLYDGEGNVIGSENPTSRHAWRVRSDYETADLGSDAASFYVKSLDDVTDSDVQTIFDQYEYDWNNWPATDGAPYQDVDSDGNYDPTIDIPGYPGATQTIWLVANDIPFHVDEDTGEECYENCAEWEQHVSQNSYGSNAIGMEMQLTMWAYDFSSTNPLGNMLFKRARLSYTGLPGGPDDATLDTLYFAQWSDPDLGTYTDDYVGCDVDLSLGYVYNGNTLDHDFNDYYGLPVPAGGYDFLQGPVVDGDTLGMTAFTYFGAGSSISDPDLEEYAGTLQFFNLMEGYLPRPEYPEQEPWVDPVSGEETKFVLAGDPVTGEGWVDGIQLPPGDRRLVMATGPFQMAKGETQDVVLALVGGMGGDNLSSITVLKYYDEYAQFAYDNDFNLPNPPVKPSVSAFGGDGYIALNWGSNAEAVSATEDPVTLGYSFEGYKVYQLPSASASSTEGVLVAQFDVINDVGTIEETVIDPMTGFPIQYPVHIGTNGGIQRYLEITEDKLRNRPISNDRSYYFGISAYSALTEPVGGEPFQSLESDIAVVAVLAQMAGPETEYAFDYGSDVPTVHNGTAGGSVNVTVINPAELTDASYEVYFDEQHYYMDFDGEWKETAYADSVGLTRDVSLSSITGISITAPTAGTRDLTFTVEVVSPDYNYASGVLLTFPSEISINSVSSADGIAAMIAEDGSNSVMFGDMDVDGAGDFSGGQVVVVNVDTPTLPLDVDYIIYDDGWAQLWCVDNPSVCEAYSIGPGFTELLNAEGTVSITEEAYAFKTVKHWNMRNTTSDEILLEDMHIINGVSVDDYDNTVLGSNDLPIVDGFQIDVSVGYSAPVNYESISDNSGYYGSSSYTIGSYFDYGWAATAKSADAFGNGFTSVDFLQRDVKVVWDGEYGDPDENGFVPVISGGSQVWLYGVRNDELINHPSPDNPGTGEPFLITVPFKVYDLESGDEPVQISMIIYDRIQTYDGTYDGDGDGVPAVYAFNPYNRMYSEFVNRPYEETLADFSSNEAYLTWNTVWWGAPYESGDEVTFVYANPIQLGVDTWTFATSAPTSSDVTDEEVERINVFPNPYYGFHDLETSRSGKYVTFNHLPQNATIRIFNLGGIMVRKIDKNDVGQYAEWNLKNQSGYPVASGVYIAHIELPDSDKQKILKIALVQEEQILNNY